MNDDDLPPPCPIVMTYEISAFKRGIARHIAIGTHGLLVAVHADIGVRWELHFADGFVHGSAWAMWYRKMSPLEQLAEAAG